MPNYSALSSSGSVAYDQFTSSMGPPEAQSSSGLESGQALSVSATSTTIPASKVTSVNSESNPTVDTDGPTTGSVSRSTEASGALVATGTSVGSRSSGILRTSAQMTTANPDAGSTSNAGHTTWWLPGSIQVQTLSTNQGTSSFNPAVTATLPQIIAPPTTVVTPENARKITVGFRKELNYEFLVGSPMTAAQIFNFLPSVLSFPFEEADTTKVGVYSSYRKRDVRGVALAQFNGTTTLAPDLRLGDYQKQKRTSDFNTSTVEVIQIMPLLVKGRSYLTSIAVVYFPSNFVSELQSYISDESSIIYHNTDSTMAALAALIDSSIPLTGLVDDSTLTGQGNGGGSSSGGNTSQNSQNSRSKGGNSGSLESSATSKMTSSVKKRLVVYLTCLVVGALLWICVFLFLYKHLLRTRVRLDLYETTTMDEKHEFSVGDITTLNSNDSGPDNEKVEQNSHQRDAASASSHSRFSLPEDLLITGENTVYSVSHGLQYYVAEDGSFYYAGALQSTSEENDTTKADTADVEDVNDYLYSAEQEGSVATTGHTSCDIGSLQIDEDGNFVVSDPTSGEEDQGFTSSNSATVEFYNNNNLYKMTKTLDSDETSNSKFLKHLGHEEMSGAGMGQEHYHGSFEFPAQEWLSKDTEQPGTFPSGSVFGFYGSDSSNNIAQSLPNENCIDEYLYVGADNDSLLDSPLGVQIEEIDDDAVDVHVEDLDELDEEMYKRRSKFITQQQRSESSMLHMSRVLTAKSQTTRRN